MFKSKTPILTSKIYTYTFSPLRAAAPELRKQILHEQARSAAGEPIAQSEKLESELRAGFVRGSEPRTCLVSESKREKYTY